MIYKSERVQGIIAQMFTKARAEIICAVQKAVRSEPLLDSENLNDDKEKEWFTTPQGIDTLENTVNKLGFSIFDSLSVASLAIASVRL